MDNNNNLGYTNESVNDKVVVAMTSKVERMKLEGFDLKATAMVINPIAHDCVVIEKAVKTDAGTKNYVAVILVNSDMVTNPKELLVVGSEVLAPANNVDAKAIEAIKRTFATPSNGATAQTILIPIYSKLENLEKNITIAYDTIVTVATGKLMELTRVRKGLIGTKLSFDPMTNIIKVKSFNKEAADSVVTANTRGSNLEFSAHLNHVLVKTKDGDKLFKQIVIKDDETSSAKTIADLFLTLTTQFGDTDQLNARSKIDFGYLLPLFGQKRTSLIGKGDIIKNMFAGTLVSMDLKAYTSNSNIKRIITAAVEKGGDYTNVLISELNKTIGFPLDFSPADVFLLGEVRAWGTMVDKNGNSKAIENLTLAEIYATGIADNIIADFKGGTFVTNTKFLSNFNPSCEVEGSLMRITFTANFIKKLAECYAAKGYVREQVFTGGETAINPYLGVNVMAGNLDAYQTSTTGGSTSTGFIMI